MKPNSIPKLYNSVLSLSAALTAPEVYKVIVDEACALVNAEFGSIFLFSNGLKRFYSTVPIEKQTEPRKNGFSYEAFIKRKVITVTLKQISHAHPEFNNPDIKSFILIPLAYENKSIGILSLESKHSHHFTKSKQHLLQLLGSISALKLHNTHLYEENRQALLQRELFISMASHELKTPLTTIFGYLQMMYTKVKNQKLPDINWMETMLTEAKRLEYLINELLQTDQIKTGAFQYIFERHSLLDILQSVLNSFESSNPSYKFIFDYQKNNAEPLVYADRDKLIQVLNNILSNAIKFSSKNKVISISLKDRLNNLELQIQDKGTGINEQDLPKIFERFFKAQDHTEFGMGLGLYISKKIIEKHRGNIEAKSNRNGGTTMVITLPLVYASE